MLYQCDVCTSCQGAFSLISRREGMTQNSSGCIYFISLFDGIKMMPSNRMITNF